MPLSNEQPVPRGPLVSALLDAIPGLRTQDAPHMRPNLLIASFCSAALFSLACCRLSLAADNIDARAVDLIQNAVKVHGADRQRFQHVVGTGRIEFVRADNQAYYTCSMAFRLSGHNMFVDLERLESVPEDEFPAHRIQVLNEGGSYIKQVFSPDLKPNGCKTTHRRLARNQIGLGVEATRISPRYLLDPMNMETAEAAEAWINGCSEVRLAGEVNELPQVEARSQRGTYVKLWFDRAYAGRLVKAERGRLQDQVPLDIFEYSWRESSNGVVPAEYTFLQRDSTGKRLHTHRFLVDTFKAVDEATVGNIDKWLLQDCAGNTLEPPIKLIWRSR